MAQAAKMGLTSFMKEYKVVKGSNYTHTSLGDPAGSYYLNADLHDRFYELYETALSAGTKLHMTERQNVCGPVVIDLDFRYLPDDSTELHKYTDEEIDAFILSYMRCLGSYVNYEEMGKPIDIYVQEKPSLRKEESMVKDGVHLMIPEIVTSPAVKYLVREAMIDQDLGIYDGCTNKPSDIMDEAVIERNPWYLYGSCKPGSEHAYSVTRIVTYDPETDSLTASTPAKDEARAYVRLLSVRNKTKRSPERPETQERVNRVDMAMHEGNTKTASVAGSEPSSEPSAAASSAASSTSYEELEKVVMGLKAERADSYSDWARVVWATYNTAHDNEYKRRGNDLIHKFSQQSSAYNENRVEEFIYKSCNDHHPNKLTYRSLLALLKEDNPELFKKVMRKHKKTESVNEYGMEVKETPFNVLRGVLCAYAAERRYKKLDGYIYEPIEGCRCGYVRTDKTYESFINEVLGEHPLYLMSPNRFEECKKFMKNYNPKELSNIVKNRDIISFSNGILKLSTREFHAYDGLPAEYENEVARTHINAPFEGEKATPLFDKLLLYQMDEEIMKYMYFFIGRLFFKVHEYDSFDVMVQLYGYAATGKSLVLNVIQAMFEPSSIGVIEQTMEKVFGLEPLHNKELVISPDLPKEFSQVLPMQVWLKMISGEKISIPRKGETALTLDWKAPMIYCGNSVVDYPDTMGCVSRRLVIIHFHKTVIKKDLTLEKKILKEELPAIIVKSLNTYFEMVAAHKSSEFMSWAPKYFEETSAFVQDNDYVFKFLTAGPDDNKTSQCRYYIQHRCGAITNLADVKKAFENYMKFNYRHINYKWTADYTPFSKLGYTVVCTHVCKSCGNEAKKGCCGHYHIANRTKKHVVKDLEIVKEGINMFQPIESED